MTILSTSDVSEIKDLLHHRVYRDAEVATMFGVSKSLISKIRNGVRHVTTGSLYIDRVLLKGSECGMSKLTEEDVVDIKMRLAGGESSGTIHKDYPVSQSAICGIKAGKTWKHVS